MAKNKRGKYMVSLLEVTDWTDGKKIKELDNSLRNSISPILINKPLSVGLRGVN